MNPHHHPQATRLGRFASLMALLILCWSTIAQEAPKPGTINLQDLYAAFLTKFPHFVTWADANERTAARGVRLGVLGKSALNQRAMDSIAAQVVGGRPFIVTQLRSHTEIHDLDMLYVGPSEADQIKVIIEAARGKNILTISAIPDFAKRGGMINFVTRNGKTRFEINLNKVKEEKIRISAKLLRTAIIVE